MRRHKTVEIMGYLNFCLLMEEYGSPIRFPPYKLYLFRIIEAQKNTDSTDLDPEHYCTQEM
jgi:hypothetical protein